MTRTALQQTSVQTKGAWRLGKAAQAAFGARTSDPIMPASKPAFDSARSAMRAASRADHSPVQLPEPSLRAQSALLLSELAHRMNNELASAISMLSLVAARSKHAEAKAALGKVMDRLQSYSIVHRALQMPERPGETDASAYLRRLCLAISQSKLDGRNVKLVLADSPLRLRAEQCWLLGMIVNELITNAVRHAFDEAGGEIRVKVVTREQMVECRVSDNGTARGDICPGRGLRIVRELSTALGGGIAHRFGQHGSVAILTFPAPSPGDRMAPAPSPGDRMAQTFLST